MSATIILHQELSIAGTWHHVAQVYPPTFCYEIFHMLGYSGRRNEDSEDALVELKGFPSDASAITLLDRKTDENDEYIIGESWANAKEIAKVMDRYRKLFGRPERHLDLGYLFGHGWEEWVFYPQDCERLRAGGVQDIRWVYWFYN